MLCVYRSVPETMLWHNNTINDDFHIFEKIDFLKFKSWLKKWKLKILRRIRVRIQESFYSNKFHYSPPNPAWKVHLHLYFPHVYQSLIFLKTIPKHFNFWTFLDIKLNFYFYFLKLFLSKNMDSELSDAFSNVIWSLELITVRYLHLKSCSETYDSFKFWLNSVFCSYGKGDLPKMCFLNLFETYFWSWIQNVLVASKNTHVNELEIDNE